MDTYAKDPDAVLDYSINWAPWLLEVADTIATSLWVVPVGITKTLETSNTTSTTIWLSAGAVGSQYVLVNRITTTGGRIDERAIGIVVRPSA